MNAKQQRQWDKWFRSNRKRYPVCYVAYPPKPMAHLSIMVSKYIDVAPYELMQIHDDGKLVPC